MSQQESFSKMVAALVKPGEDILSSLTPNDCHILHMCVGITGEVGELVDAVKKSIIYGKPLDRENIVEELGDIFFYMEGLMQGLGITQQECIEANIAKLSVRYAKGKYSNEQAVTRADKTEEFVIQDPPEEPAELVTIYTSYYEACYAASNISERLKGDYIVHHDLTKGVYRVVEFKSDSSIQGA